MHDIGPASEADTDPEVGPRYVNVDTPVMVRSNADDVDRCNVTAVDVRAMVHAMVNYVSGDAVMMPVMTMPMPRGSRRRG